MFYKSTDIGSVSYGKWQYKVDRCTERAIMPMQLSATCDKILTNERIIKEYVDQELDLVEFEVNKEFSDRLEIDGNKIAEMLNNGFIHDISLLYRFNRFKDEIAKMFEFGVTDFVLEILDIILTSGDKKYLCSCIVGKKYQDVYKKILSKTEKYLTSIYKTEREVKHLVKYPIVVLESKNNMLLKCILLEHVYNGHLRRGKVNKKYLKTIYKNYIEEQVWCQDLCDFYKRYSKLKGFIFYNKRGREDIEQVRRFVNCIFDVIGVKNGEW